MLEAEILKSTGQRLSIWETTGEVIWYERLQCGRVKTQYGSWIKLCRPGTPDYCAIVRNQTKGLDLLFIECKRADGKGKLSDVQIKFQNKYKNVQNTHYLIIDHPDYVDHYIDNICIDRIKEINL